jgi:hypothetical protein
MNQVLAQLSQATSNLEEMYAENEGEITEATEQAEEQISCLKQLLNTEGVDLLGRWLKGKEDRKKALKAEKDYITRQMAAIDEGIDFIKVKINQILTATGQEKIKGDCGYAFKATTSVTTTINKEDLDKRYLEQATEGARQFGLPEWLDIQLKTTTTRMKEAGGNALLYLEETSKATCTFTKPRANKEG